MSTSTRQLKCIERKDFGSSFARRARRQGMTPVVVYKKNKESLSFMVNSNDLMLLHKKGTFLSVPVDLIIDDANSMKVIAKNVQYHPIKDFIMHVEFLVDEGEERVLDIPLFYENLDKSPGFKKSAFFNIIKRRLKIKGKIANMPAMLSKDVSDMQTGQVILAQDIKLPEGYSLAEDPKRAIASMIGKGGARGAGAVAATEEPETATA